MNTTQEDDLYITFTNAAHSKKAFLTFLEAMDEEVAYEFVDELWSDSDVKSFWKQWSGDLNQLGQQVILFDCEISERLELV